MAPLFTPVTKRLEIFPETEHKISRKDASTGHQQDIFRQMLKILRVISNYTVKELVVLCLAVMMMMMIMLHHH